MRDKIYCLKRWQRSPRHFTLCSGKRRLLTLRKIAPDEALSQTVDFISARERIKQEEIMIVPINNVAYILRVSKKRPKNN